jgi:hypothetical protein
VVKIHGGCNIAVLERLLKDHCTDLSGPLCAWLLALVVSIFGSGGGQTLSVSLSTDWKRLANCLVAD